MNKLFPTFLTLTEKPDFLMCFSVLKSKQSLAYISMFLYWTRLGLYEQWKFKLVEIILFVIIIYY